MSAPPPNNLAHDEMREAITTYVNMAAPGKRRGPKKKRRRGPNKKKKMPEKKNVCLNLAAEIYENIMMYLDAVSVARLSMTCRTAREASQSDDVWSEVLRQASSIRAMDSWQHGAVACSIRDLSLSLYRARRVRAGDNGTGTTLCT